MTPPRLHPRVAHAQVFVNRLVLPTEARQCNLKGMKRPEDLDTREFGKRLRRFLDAAGITPKEFASQIGRSWGYVRSILVGVKGPPGRETLERMATVLGISVDALIGAEPEDEVVRLIALRRGLGVLANDIDPRYRDLVKVYTFRQQVARADIPEGLRRELLHDIDRAIAEYERLVRESEAS